MTGWPSIPAMVAATVEAAPGTDRPSWTVGPSSATPSSTSGPGASVPRSWPRGSRRATGSRSGPGNRAEWIVAVLGLLNAGAVLVPVNTRFKGAEAADILLGAGPGCS